MWILCVEGFYSVASAQKADGSIDPETVMIRARCKRHLQNLQARFPALSGSKIITLPNRDYRYRLVVLKRIWISVLSELAGEQRWSNFKAEVERRQGKADAAYIAALHEVWRIMARLQGSD